MKHTDNLQPQGNFSVRKQEEWAPGERAPVIKREDNLKPEGHFHSKPETKWAPGTASIFKCKFRHIFL